MGIMNFIKEALREPTKDELTFTKIEEIYSTSYFQPQLEKVISKSMPINNEFILEKFPKNISTVWKYNVYYPKNVRFEKDGVYLSVHALSRLLRLNKPGYPNIEESDVLTIVKGNPNYSEGESKLIFFDSGKQLVVVKNKDTDDIVSIVRRKMPKEVWECV